MPTVMRRWRDRTNKIVHAWDPTQNITWDVVRTLCKLPVIIEHQHTYGSTIAPLEYIPDEAKRTADLPKPTTKLTCMSCLALLW